MGITNKKLHAIISESIKRTINEISLDTLAKADDAAGVNGEVDDISKERHSSLYPDSVSNAISVIRNNLDYFPNSREANQCHQYLDAIKKFFIRKAKQKDTFYNAATKRKRSATDKFEKIGSNMYGKDKYNMTDDEWENVRRNIDTSNDDDLRWAAENY